MGNVVLYKPATASSFVMPYAPGKAVDGSLQNFSRWLSNTTPCWLSVNLQNKVWINRWVVKHLPYLGWTGDYVLAGYKLQGSLDGLNWLDLDVVSNNTSATTDRTIPGAAEVSYVRLYVTSGLRPNPQMSSIAELEIYEAPPTSPYLSNLTVSSGTLIPDFSSTTFNYTVNVGYEVDQITVTPTAQDPEATITVNGVVVPSGQPAPGKMLEVGDNALNIKVTSKIGGLVQNYSINVVRASNPYLSGLVVKVNGTKAVTLNPAFASTVYDYSATTQNMYSQVTVTPTAVDPEATIKVAGNVVVSGQPSALIDIAVGPNLINVEVTPKTGVDPKTYAITVTRM